MLRRRRGDGEQWAVSAGEYDGRPIVTRFDHSHRRQAGKAGKPIRIGVAVELTAPDDRGFPEEAESERLNAVEGRLVELVGDRAALVGVITTNGTREWLLYSDTSDWIEAFHHDLDDATPDFEVQVMAERDPDWDVYKAFV